ncbi:hypothetical protein PIROE2DRAFT_64869 [Piromyces sp. E2]|nr:hypothetical protein PIROE2DRAFT_64869 [Piromyces sp. E2]|eukprot:OUM57668.1 hypothetical protein PIROE2DRAFT_64869 [Piromyces sp. E2]
MNDDDYLYKESNTVDVDINNLVNNQVVYYNEINLPYATSLTLSLPKGKEVTSMELEKVEWTGLVNDGGSSFTTEAVVKLFNQFENYTPQDQLIIVRPEQELVAIREPINEENNHNITLENIEVESPQTLLDPIKVVWTDPNDHDETVTDTNINVNNSRVLKTVTRDTPITTNGVQSISIPGLSKESRFYVNVLITQDITVQNNREYTITQNLSENDPIVIRPENGFDCQMLLLL